MSQAGSYENGTIAPNVEFLTGNIGGPVGPDALFNINVVGAGGITVTGNPGTNTLTITGTGILWTREAGAAVAMINNHGYINTNAGLTTFTLPVNASVGDVIEIAGESAGLFRIAQNAGQSIQMGLDSTTVGAGGSLTAVNRYNTIRMVCRVANTNWSVLSNIGVYNVV